MNRAERYQASSIEDLISSIEHRHAQTNPFVNPQNGQNLYHLLTTYNIYLFLPKSAPFLRIFAQNARVFANLRSFSLIFSIFLFCAYVLISHALITIFQKCPNN